MIDQQDNTMNKIVTIFGGSGMVGCAITQEFTKLGYQVRIATRRPSKMLCYANIWYTGSGHAYFI